MTSTNEAFICDGIRTPIGRYGGSLSGIRADDLAAIPLRALMERNPNIDWSRVDDVIMGAANQSGEDNRNVARMASLLAGMDTSVPGCTINRLCGSGMDAVSIAARSIRSGEHDLVVAGGSESMSRAPFVVGKGTTAFARDVNMYDTTMGWRFVNKLLDAQYGVESMPETAENVAQDYNISREDQDKFALRSQERAAKAQKKGFFDGEIAPVEVRVSRKETRMFEKDEHPRAGSTLEKMAALPTPFRSGGTVTAGNASGINDGACAMIVASSDAVKHYDMKPLARVVGTAVAGVEPRVMGIGPVPATQKLLERTELSIEDIAVVELNEAFAAQGLAVMRELGLPDDAEHVNPNGGAIALGHPLGMSGARLVLTAARELQNRQQQYALCTMCIGVGQGIAMVIERV
ncbi:3-oxoadipyl-CoA thiolase [Kordiimonas sp. SCSIO 12610]|uniref:3-oxoadipyl-CoA thiolase n=1 Tax=Kordiimonas sp. SCSIO 12610 TaxID=2829597 RepID=UPI00210EF210|nr:3-oxoadipyl-CoA thiolase [Kordiimonas sp. SCSIO 12610]UTW55596.1 3-oxoadipyl-CoA thiolase [Kordiimonas sp. SCSIO 12610]